MDMVNIEKVLGKEVSAVLSSSSRAIQIVKMLPEYWSVNYKNSLSRVDSDIGINRSLCELSISKEISPEATAQKLIRAISHVIDEPEHLTSDKLKYKLGMSEDSFVQGMLESYKSSEGQSLLTQLEVRQDIYNNISKDIGLDGSGDVSIYEDVFKNYQNSYMDGSLDYSSARIKAANVLGSKFYSLEKFPGQDLLTYDEEVRSQLSDLYHDCKMDDSINKEKVLISDIGSFISSNASNSAKPNKGLST